ncbi:MAG: hypothetical protein N3A65_08340 [candidate division WOR-3 bacterium]|nr:hypothetical protein [candidate division WOR-3 bacterium]
MKDLKIIFLITWLILLFFSTCKSNNPPEVPAIPVGLDSGAIDNHTFITWSSDPDGDSISIKFDWGDGTESNWSPFVCSGDTVSMTHFFATMGSYEIRAKARDVNNAESEWSEPHILIIGTEVFWIKEYGGYNDDFGYSIAKTSENGYVIVGATKSYGSGGYDVYLIKIDTTGNVVWEKTYGGSLDDYGHSVKTTPDGGFIIAGTTKSFGDENGDVYLIKTDNQGNPLWQKVFFAPLSDYGYDVEIIPDGYAITGMAGSYQGGGDVLLIKTDSNGDTLWIKTYGTSEMDFGNSVKRCIDNGFIIAGYSWGNVYLVRTDADGNIVWTANYGGTGSDIGSMVILTSNNNYLVVGSNGNVYVLKIDNNGNKIWEKSYGTNYTDNGYAVEQSSDGKYIIVGSAGINGSDLYYLCLDEKGNLIKEKTYGDYLYEYGRFLKINGTSAIIGGYRMNNLTRNDLYVIKIKI